MVRQSLEAITDYSERLMRGEVTEEEKIAFLASQGLTFKTEDERKREHEEILRRAQSPDNVISPQDYISDLDIENLFGFTREAWEASRRGDEVFSLAILGVPAAEAYFMLLKELDVKDPEHVWGRPGQLIAD